MSNRENPIGWLRASGTPYDIGYAMGTQGRKAVHEQLIPSRIWAAATHLEHATTINRLIESTRTRFPETLQELRGMAEGLLVPFKDVFAWNCRGDILASVPDGCTTLQTPGATIRISHNEDGPPFFRGQCFILDASPRSSMAFRAFCYPGSLAGHTFGWNNAGLVQAVNNLRLKNVDATIPRMVLGRAVLGSTTLRSAVSILSKDPNCGGFHMTLAQTGNPELLSVEYGGGKSSVVKVASRSAHANHALHLASDGQLTTRSSANRQTTVNRLIRQVGTSDLDILRNKSGPGLPIRRDEADDPDQENTLASCLFSVSKSDVEWRIYGESEGNAAYRSEFEVT